MHFARTSVPAVPGTVLPSLEWECIWRGGGKETWGGVEMGERRGCLIYSFHCCRRSSLLLSVRGGKWSVHARTKTPQKRSQSHFLSTFLMALFRVCLVLCLLVFPPLCCLFLSLSLAHKATRTCVLCLLQPCKQERPLALALTGERLRGSPAWVGFV